MARVRKKPSVNEEALNAKKLDLIAKQLVDKEYGTPPREIDEIDRILENTSESTKSENTGRLTVYPREELLKQLRREVFDNKNGNFKWGHAHTSVNAIVIDLLEKHYSDIIDKN